MVSPDGFAILFSYIVPCGVINGFSCAVHLSGGVDVIPAFKVLAIQSYFILDRGLPSDFALNDRNRFSQTSVRLKLIGTFI